MNRALLLGCPLSTNQMPKTFLKVRTANHKARIIIGLCGNARLSLHPSPLGYPTHPHLKNRDILLLEWSRPHSQQSSLTQRIRPQKEDRMALNMVMTTIYAWFSSPASTPATTPGSSPVTSPTNELSNEVQLEESLQLRKLVPGLEGMPAF
jgi:hypothetical protein